MCIYVRDVEMCICTYDTLAYIVQSESGRMLTNEDIGTIVRGDMDGNGRFAVYFAMDIWGEGRGECPLPEEWDAGRMWKEWFQL